MKYEIYYNHLENENALTRSVLFEKYRKPRLRKGSSFLEPGYIFAPYIPMFETPVVIADDFTPNTLVASRYATTQINSNFYGVLSI